MLEHRDIPYDLIKPIQSGAFAERGEIYKPKFGMMGTVPVMVRMERTYNDVKSRLEGREVWDEEEVVEIRTDKFSKYTPRIKDLADWQFRELGPIIQEFRERRESKDTTLDSWQVINESEKYYLYSQGIKSVEQLAALDPDRETDRFGRNSQELILKARRHLASKHADKMAEQQAELAALRRELDQIKAREHSRTDSYIQEQIAKSPDPVVQIIEQKRRGRPKKMVEETHNETTA